MSPEQIREEYLQGNKKLFFMQKFAGIQVEDVHVEISDLRAFFMKDELLRFPFRKEIREWLTDNEFPRGISEVELMFREIFGRGKEADQWVQDVTELFLKLIWFKAFFPKAFYGAVFSVDQELLWDEVVDFHQLSLGYHRVKRILELGRRFFPEDYVFTEENGDVWEKDKLELLELAAECMEKGISFLPENVNLSDPFLFLPEEKGIRLPFDAPSEWWNRTSTERFLAYRKEKKIASADELKQILSNREIELLKIHHAFEFLAERKRMKTLSEIFSCLGRKNNWFTWMLSDQEADLLEKTGKKLEIPENNEKMTAEEGRAEDIPAYFGTYRSKGLYAICGRPAMGKTAFLCSLALEAAKGIPVWYFGFKELAEELMFWMLKIYSKEEQKKTGKVLLEEEYAEIGKRFCELPISICDSVSTMAELEQTIREEVSGGLVILDGLEAIDLKGSVTSPEAVKQQQGRTEEICRRLKELAVERNLTVIVSTGVSRAVERRTDHRPKLTDIPGLKNGMEYFDRICAIYREAYYNWKADRSNAELLVLEGTSERTVFSELAYEDDEWYFRKAGNQK